MGLLGREAPHKFEEGKGSAPSEGTGAWEMEIRDSRSSGWSFGGSGGLAEASRGEGSTGRSRQHRPVGPLSRPAGSIGPAPSQSFPDLSHSPASMRICAPDKAVCLIAFFKSTLVLVFFFFNLNVLVFTKKCYIIPINGKPASHYYK